MAEQNEPQGTDAEYQPRTRRERRELEKRSRKAVRAQNSENAADATGAPSGRRFGRHAKYSSDASGTESQSANVTGASGSARTQETETSQAAQSGSSRRFRFGRHAAPEQPVEADTPQPQPDPEPQQQTPETQEKPQEPVANFWDNVSAPTKSNVFTERSTHASESDDDSANTTEQSDGSTHVATSKWLNSLKKAQGADSAPQTGIIETQPLKLKKSFLKNGYLGYSTMGENTPQQSSEALDAGYSALNEPQQGNNSNGSVTEPAADTDPDRTVSINRVKRSRPSRKPVSRDTRSISRTTRPASRNTAPQQTLYENPVRPKHLGTGAYSSDDYDYEYEDERSTKKSKKKDKKPELTLKQAREEGRMGEWAWTTFRESAMVVVYALVIAFIIKTFLVRGYYIPSGSMENTLQVNDRVFINAAGSYFGSPNRGDVVVFKDSQGWIDSAQKKSNPINDALTFVGILPDTSSNYLVKRVIGKPGDRVEGDGKGKIKVNGVEISEPYLHPGSNPSDVPFSVTVPNDSYFVLGDHRDHSADSRYHIGDGHAFVKRGDIQGNVFVIAWPINRVGLMTNQSDVFKSVPEPSK